MNKRFSLTSVGASKVSRRGFIVGSSALTVGIAFGRLGGATAMAQDAAGSVVAQGFEPSVFVSIEFGGKVRILYNKAEMGQGVLTGLPMIIAEEMDAEWANVAIERAPGVGPYGNQGTVGSTSTSRQFTDFRIIGAQVRRVLMMNAAEMLDVPLEELTTEPHEVVHQASGRRLNYGEIAAGGSVPETLPEITEEDLKSPSDFRLIGSRDIKRYDIPSKVNGTAVFGIDVELPEMLYGALLRAPVAGEEPVEIDDAAALNVAGVVAVVPMQNAVGVVAESLYAAKAGVAALNVSWTDTAFARGFSSDAALADGLVAIDDDAGTWTAQGDPGDFDGAERVEKLTFQTNMVAHACMEPMTATVLANEDGTFEVWAGVQNPNLAIAAVQAAAELEDAEVAINVTLLGGGFGRRNETDYVRDATALALAVKGRPVKVVWTREEDLQHDPYRPLSVQQVQAALDADNRIIGWRHRVLTPAYGAGDPTSTLASAEFEGFDFLTAGGGSHPYTEVRETQYQHMPTGIKVGAWRGISDGYMKFAIESMIDHVANLRQEDPVAFRLSMVGDDSRPGAIIRKVADMAGWDSYEAQDGRALGIGYSDALGSHTACVAEVSADRESGEITIHKIWAAIDPGTVVMPDQVAAQIEGAIVYSLSPTLKEMVAFVDGVPQVTNFFDYQVMRQNDIPDIEVAVVATDNAPGGVGEAGISPVVPAVTNALSRAMGGVHFGYLPLLPEKVLEAIEA